MRRFQLYAVPQEEDIGIYMLRITLGAALKLSISEASWEPIGNGTRMVVGTRIAPDAYDGWDVFQYPIALLIEQTAKSLGLPSGPCNGDSFTVVVEDVDILVHVSQAPSENSEVFFHLAPHGPLELQAWPKPRVFLVDRVAYWPLSRKWRVVLNSWLLPLFGLKRV